jgi:hypothetical protein
MLWHREKCLVSTHCHCLLSGLDFFLHDSRIFTVFCVSVLNFVELSIDKWLKFLMKFGRTPKEIHDFCVLTFMALVFNQGIYCRAYLWQLYKTGWIDNWIYWITHNYSVSALQLTTVHYNTCRVFTLCLHSLPVSQYRRICLPATLQLFSEDCCSARTLTRNWNCPRHLVNSA